MKIFRIAGLVLIAINIVAFIYSPSSLLAVTTIALALLLLFSYLMEKKDEYKKKNKRIVHTGKPNEPRKKKKR